MFKGLTYTVLNFEKKIPLFKNDYGIDCTIIRQNYMSIINEYFQKLVGQIFLII